MTTYRVPFENGESAFTEKRSRFISHIWRVETEAEARERIEEMKKRYYDARHQLLVLSAAGGRRGPLLRRRGAPGHGGPAHAERVPAGERHQRVLRGDRGTSAACCWGQGD